MLYYFQKRWEEDCLIVCPSYNLRSNGCMYGKNGKTCSMEHICVCCKQLHGCNRGLCNYKEKVAKESPVPFEKRDIVKKSDRATFDAWRTIQPPLLYKAVLKNTPYVVFPMEISEPEYTRKLFDKISGPLYKWAINLHINGRVPDEERYLLYCKNTYVSMNEKNVRKKDKRKSFDDMPVHEEDPLSLLNYLIFLIPVRLILCNSYASQCVSNRFKNACYSLKEARLSFVHYYMDNDGDRSNYSAESAFKYASDLLRCILYIERERPINVVYIKNCLNSIKQLCAQLTWHTKYKQERCDKEKNEILPENDYLLAQTEELENEVFFDQFKYIPTGDLRTLKVVEERVVEENVEKVEWLREFPLELTNKDYIWRALNLLSRSLPEFDRDRISWPMELQPLLDTRDILVNIRNMMAHGSTYTRVKGALVRKTISQCILVSPDKVSLERLFEQYLSHKVLRNSHTTTVPPHQEAYVPSDREALIRLFPPVNFDSQMTVEMVNRKLDDTGFTYSDAEVIPMEWRDYRDRFEHLYIKATNSNLVSIRFDNVDQFAIDECASEESILKEWLGDGHCIFMDSFVKYKLAHQFLKHQFGSEDIMAFHLSSKSNLFTADYRLCANTRHFASEFDSSSKIINFSFVASSGRVVTVTGRMFKHKKFEDFVSFGLQFYMRITSHNSILCSLLLMQVQHIQSYCPDATLKYPELKVYLSKLECTRRFYKKFDQIEKVFMKIEKCNLIDVEQTSHSNLWQLLDAYLLKNKYEYNGFKKQLKTMCIGEIFDFLSNVDELKMIKRCHDLVKGSIWSVYASFIDILNISSQIDSVRYAICPKLAIPTPLIANGADDEENDIDKVVHAAGDLHLA